MDTKYDQLLADALNFNEDDIKMNVNRRVTNRQIRALRVQIFKQFSLGFLLLLVVIPVGAAVGYLVARGFGMFASLVISWLLFGVFLMVQGTNGLFRRMKDLQEKQVESLKGQVTLDIQQHPSRFNMQQSDTIQYTVSVAGKTFIVEKSVLLAFKNGEFYNLYYMPYSDTLLSAEWIR